MRSLIITNTYNSRLVKQLGRVATFNKSQRDSDILIRAVLIEVFQGSLMWYVYILECSDQTLYTGITTDLKRRVAEHNSFTKGAKYTKSRRPVKMVYSGCVPTKSEAQKEEYRIRKLTKKEKLKLAQKK